MQIFIFKNDFKTLEIDANNYQEAVDIVELDYNYIVGINIEFIGIKPE